MNITNANLDTIKHDLSKTNKAIESLYSSLGCYSVESVGQLFYPPAESVFKLAFEALERRKEIESRISSVEKALELLDNGGNEISKSQSNVKKIAENIDTLTESLGAIAYEIYNSGALPASLSSSLDCMREFDDKTRHIMDQVLNCSSRVKKVFLERQLENHKKHITKSFYQTGIALLESPNLSQLPGSRAGAIFEQIKILTQQIQSVRQVMDQKASDISDAQISLRNMGVLGGEIRSLKELEQKKKKEDEELENLYLQYGNVLADGMDQWLPSCSDPGLKEYCRRIKVENSRLKKQKLNQDFLLAQRDIEILEAQSGQMKTQLDHLIEEKEFVERQIKDIQSKICNNDDGISVLREKQEKISQMTVDMNPGDLK